MADIPDDIEAFLSLGSRLPVLREDCLYHATQNIWVPEASLKKMKASERDVCLAVKFVFQLAKTANAKCRKCGLPIQREEIRLGYPISDPRGLHGVLMAWLHLKCGGKVISAAGKALKLGETDSERPSVESLSEAAEECVESGSTSPITDSIAGAVPASSDSAHLSIAASVDDSMADSEVASGLAEGLLAFVASSSDKENDDQSSAATDGAKLVEANKLVESVALPDAVLQSFFPAVSCLFFDWELLDDEKKYLVTRFALSEEIAENEDAGANVMKDMVRRVLTERYPPPPDLLMPLLPFQEEGLAWMCNQEISSVRGGILADEMGMGKTIQMIALLLTRQYRVASEPSMGDVLMPEGRGATLVVVPVAAVSQWKAEIERFSRPGSLRVLLYHGNGREALLSTLHLYDVVITTYSTVENDYRRVVNTHKSPCKYCGRMFLSEKLKIHQRYHCGPDADRTARQSKTEQKSKDAAQKAMKTLNIVAAAPSEEPPTLTNVYRSILRDGNRHEELNNLQRVPWLASRRRRTPEVVEREDIWMVPSDERKASPNGKKAASLNGKKAASLNGKKAASPNGKKAASPNGKKTASPNGKRTASPNEDSRSESVKRKRLKKTNNVEVASSGVPDRFLEAFFQLLSMGFEPGPSASALRASDGNMEVAVELLSSRKEEVAQAAEEAVAFEAATAETPAERRKRRRLERSHELRRVFHISKTQIRTLKVAELQRMLREIDEPSFGTKVELVNRLTLLMFPEDDDEPRNRDEASSAARVKKEGKRLSMKKEVKEEPNFAANMSDGYIKPRKGSMKTRSKKKRNEEPRVVAVFNEDSSSVQSGSSNLSGSRSDDRPRRAVRACRRQAKRKEKVARGESNSEASNSDDENYCETSESSSDEASSSPAPSQTRKKSSKGKPANQPVKQQQVEQQAEPARAVADPAARAEDEYADPYASTEEDEGVDASLSPLHAVTWKRIVLDEAHRIKGRTTSTAKAIYALKASKSKWCLSGTPLQNRVGELYSLVRFLRFDPFAFYFCSKPNCRCRSLHYRFVDNAYCVKCKHARMSHYSYFNRKVVTPIVKHGSCGKGKEALRVLKEEVLEKILLRRTKVERAEDVCLPELVTTICKKQMTPFERDFYESLYKETCTQFDTYVEAGTVLHNFAHIFDLLSRLRQAVLHPYLVTFGNLSLTGQVEIPAPARGESDTCVYCQEDIDGDDGVTTACQHAFHNACVREYIETNQEKLDGQNQVLGCPKCFRRLTVDFLREEGSRPAAGIRPGKKGILSRFKTSEYKSSTKIDALLEALQNAWREEPEAKCIVFSQFTSLLDLIEWRLKKEGANCVKLVGSLSRTARDNILIAFNSDPLLKIILISLKAGGEGLNLQVASRIYLMDPWWNPAAEQQAIQRAHRIGQCKSVRAVRFICEDTIEEKMLKLQEKKQLVFDGTIGASSESLGKLTAEDLCFLFKN